MKQHRIRRLLAACLLLALLPQASLPARAAGQRLDASPQPAIEYAEAAETPMGTIRYVSQITAYESFYDAYWGPDYRPYARGECFTACISMALSYTGVNATPRALGDYWISRGYTYGVPFTTAPGDVAGFGAAYASLPFAEAMELYKSGGGRYSPPILHLNRYSRNGHYVVIAGHRGGSKYVALDPAARSGTMELTISGGTVIYFSGGVTQREPLGEAVQYRNTGLHSDGTLCPGRAFSDMPPEGYWSHAAIDHCVEQKLLCGVSSTYFGAKEPLLRGQLVTILWRQAGAPEPQSAAAFTDLTANYYRKAIAWAAENGIVYGRSKTAFAPEEPLIRQDLAAILHRYARDFVHADVSASADLSAFPDAGAVSGYAREAMAWANGAGILHGVRTADGTVRLVPQGRATREQTAQVFLMFAPVPPEAAE